MAQPVWITPVGSLGVIPEGQFYQTALLAATPTLVETECTATSATTNIITCASTAGMWYNQNVIFTGSLFGGILPNVRYFVFEIVSATEFKIAEAELSVTPFELTNGTGSMLAVVDQHVYYKLIAGSLPSGIQCSDNGLIIGVPDAVASLQGIPLPVNNDVTSKFTIRGYTLRPVNGVFVEDGLRDRTFSLTVTGNFVPEFVTPAGSLGTFYDGDRLNYQIEYTDHNVPNSVVEVTLASGQLPPGTIVTLSGLITGYIEPAVSITSPPGYDLTPEDTKPYDFPVGGENKNYQFTLQLANGKNVMLRTFEIYVYDRNTLTADTTSITSDSTTVTADETPIRKPFILNASPSDLGTVRSDNYYAYQFVGNDYDTPNINYAIGVNQGTGLPPGLTLDTNSGWYYGYIPDQGITQIEYSFNIVAYQSDFVSTVTVTNTTFGTNLLTCADTGSLGVGQPLIFSGTTFGGITAGATVVYYVHSIYSATQFTVAQQLDATAPTSLTTASGSMSANLIVASDPYPYTLTISGAIDAEVTWLTPSDLGSIDNGDTSLLYVAAENRGGRTLKYRLKSGAYNQLPQGLELLPSGEISGRVSFDTFAVDLGFTTFDKTQAVVRNVSVSETTFDSTFEFTVNAYAEDTGQILYAVESVTVVNGGSGYSAINTPAVAFSSPVGAGATTAIAGTVTVDAGAITAVAVADEGAGYTGTATVSITEGFGGAGAVLTAKMKVTGARDVVSVFKTFTIKVVREYNEPYQNLYIQALPPANDRELIAGLLSNENIFVPDYIYRPDDPFFGKAKRVNYWHAFGLAPAVLDLYVESLYKNHYWKELILGSVETAQAVDPITGEVVYEVVYSKIVDLLVNDAGQSEPLEVPIPYPIVDPADGSTLIGTVFPNSLVDMRNRVVDTVGAISNKLPLWMNSKQTDGRVLGFTPAWVICYTKPGRSAQIAYYMSQDFGTRLNQVDFKVDRYILDSELSANWDSAAHKWVPTANLTTFDRFNTGGKTFLTTVSIATSLAYTDVNQRTLAYINSLGGLDGKILNINGNTLVFAKQEDYDGPPGSSYATTAEGWQDYPYPFSSDDFDTVLYDQGSTIPTSPVNKRMAIYTITHDPVTDFVTLTLTTQPEVDDFVQIERGTFYRSAQLYYPSSPAPGKTEVDWEPLPTVVTAETIFDQGSLAFVEPVDMYDPGNARDKYLVFPKTNILV